MALNLTCYLVEIWLFFFEIGLFLIEIWLFWLEIRLFRQWAAKSQNNPLCTACSSFIVLFLFRNFEATPTWACALARALFSGFYNLWRDFISPVVTSFCLHDAKKGIWGLGTRVCLNYTILSQDSTAHNWDIIKMTFGVCCAHDDDAKQPSMTHSALHKMIIAYPFFLPCYSRCHV